MSRRKTMYTRLKLFTNRDMQRQRCKTTAGLSIRSQEAYK